MPIVAIALLLTLMASPQLHAQRPGGGGVAVPAPPSGAGTAAQATTGEHLLLSGVNALLGGVTAGTLRVLRGGSFREGFSGGALGGGVTYVGKIVVLRDVPAAGLMGRGIGSLGGSITRNAGAGLAPLERLTLPVGPVRLHFEPQRRLAPVVTLDLTGAAALAWTIISYDELEWDVAESLAAGTPVGRLRSTDWDASRLARNYAGTILLSPGYSAAGRLQRQRILGHELVHTLQYDQSYLLWGDPLDRLALRRDHPDGIRHHLDLGLQTIAVLLAQRAIPYESQPWEVEARLLSPLEPETIGDGPRLQTVAPY